MPKRIVADPEVLGGKPVVEGTRLSVTHILGLLSNGMDIEQITEIHPELDREDVLRVIGYAADALANEIYIESD